jgi:hypothetical protein
MMNASRKHHTGLGIWTVLCLVFIGFVIYSDSMTNKLLFAAPVGVILYLFFSLAGKWGKRHHKTNVGAAQNDLMHLMKDDQELFERIKIQARKKGLNEEEFHKYMQVELAELDKAMKDKFETLAHKKLVICSTLIQIFENIDENWQTHALKDHHMGWRKAKPGKPIDNEHGKTRRDKVEDAFAHLEELCSIKILNKYMHVLDVQIGTIPELTKGVSVKESLRVVGDDFDKSPDEVRASFHKAKDLTEHEMDFIKILLRIYKAQQHLLKEASHSYMSLHGTNHILTAPLHDAHVLGVRNTLKGFYVKAAEEQKVLHQLFDNEDIKRKLLAGQKKAQ